MGAENLRHLGRCSADRGRLGPAFERWAGGSWSVRRCDDRRFAGLKLIFLIVSRVISLLRLSRREAWWKDAEILILRYQLTVVQRERPRVRAWLTWPDRAWLALLAGTLPVEHLAGMRLIVTPATILRWHRGVVGRRWARLPRQSRSGRPATRCSVGRRCCGWWSPTPTALGRSPEPASWSADNTAPGSRFGSAAPRARRKTPQDRPAAPAIPFSLAPVALRAPLEAG
jgi:hypothetical protein